MFKFLVGFLLPNLILVPSTSSTVVCLDRHVFNQQGHIRSDGTRNFHSKAEIRLHQTWHQRNTQNKLLKAWNISESSEHQKDLSILQAGFEQVGWDNSR